MTGAAEAFIDTNVLIYAVDSSSPYYEAARSVLRSNQKTYAISPQIVFEFLSLVTNAKRVRSPLTTEQAHNALEIILSRQNLQVLPIDRAALRRALSLASKYSLTGPRVFDSLVAGVMLEHQIPVVITANVKHYQLLGLAAEQL